MAGLFSPKVPPPVPVVNQSDMQNRMNDAMARQLAAGGVTADNTGAPAASTGPGRLPTLTGLA